ncbi:MAG: hypothetical protein ABIJ97_15995, partial [Bacteroidota bacterium]
VQGADQYQFHVYDYSGFDEILTKNVNYFSLSELTSQVDYQSDYDIRVRSISGPDTSNYGQSCTINTESLKIPTDIDPYLVPGFVGKERPRPDQIPEYSTKSTTSGKIVLIFEDVLNSSGTGFDAPGNGLLWQNCAIEVMEYIESVINIPGTVTNEPIEIYIESFNLTYNPGTLDPAGIAYAFILPDNPSPNTFLNGYLFDHIYNGYDPDPMEYDGIIAFNFFWPFSTNCNSTTLNCEIDFYTVMLHEVTHLLGFTSSIGIDGPPTYPTYTFISRYEQSLGIPNVFSRFDELFMYYYNGTTFDKIVIDNGGVPGINPAINATPSNISNKLWLDSSPITGNNPRVNQPILYCFYGGTTINKPGTYFTHFDPRYIDFNAINPTTERAHDSPQFSQTYVMDAYTAPEEIVREYSMQDIRVLQQLDYSINSTIQNIGNTPPYCTGNMLNTHLQHPVYCNETPPAGNSLFYFVTDNDHPITFDLSSMTYNGLFSGSLTGMHDIDNDPISVYNGDDGIVNIRGCGNNGNNHDQITISGSNDIITYTPRTNFIGRAQFGFNLFDGKEKGAYVIISIDVQKSGSFVNNPPDELVINGSFEEGIEVKTLSDPAVPWNYYSFLSWFADGKQFYSDGWDDVYVRNSYKQCTFSPHPATTIFGYSIHSFGITGTANNASSFGGDRYNNAGCNPYAYYAGEPFNMTLSEDMIENETYCLSFDILPRDHNDFNLIIGFFNYMDVYYTVSPFPVPIEQHAISGSIFTTGQWNQYQYS